MSALATAAEMQPGSSVKWRRLEMAAFSGHPKVVEQLDPARKHGRKGVSGGFLLALPLMLLVAAIYVAPVWGFTTLIGDRFGRSNPDPARTIPTAGIIFAIGLVLLVVSFVMWLRRGRRRSPGSEGQAGISLVLGAISAVIIAVAGVREGVVGWQFWLVPVALSTVIGGAFLVLLLRARRSTPPPTPVTDRGSGDGRVSDGRVSAVEPLKRVREQVERLAPQEQAAARADITSAIADLERRGVISAPDAAWARGAELGKLALRMSQGRGPVATNPRGA